MCEQFQVVWDLDQILFWEDETNDDVRNKCVHVKSIDKKIVEWYSSVRSGLIWYNYVWTKILPLIWARVH